MTIPTLAYLKKKGRILKILGDPKGKFCRYCKYRKDWDKVRIDEKALYASQRIFCYCKHRTAPRKKKVFIDGGWGAGAPLCFKDYRE